MGLRPIERRADPALTLRPAGGPPRRRGVLGGLVVFAVGFAFLLPAIRLPNAGPILFLALGGAFAAAYWLGYRQFVYLVPAAVMIGLGIGLLLPAIFDLGRLAAPVFFGALAAAFVTVTILAPDHRWPLLPAAPLAIIAVAGVVGGVDILPALQPFILPVVLMLVGGYLLIEPAQR
jgi:hypothetical protein